MQDLEAYRSGVVSRLPLMTADLMSLMSTALPNLCRLHASLDHAITYPEPSKWPLTLTALTIRFRCMDQKRLTLSQQRWLSTCLFQMDAKLMQSLQELTLDCSHVSFTQGFYLDSNARPEFLTPLLKMTSLQRFSLVGMHAPFGSGKVLGVCVGPWLLYCLNSMPSLKHVRLEWPELTAADTAEIEAKSKGKFKLELLTPRKFRSAATGEANVPPPPASPPAALSPSPSADVLHRDALQSIVSFLEIRELMLTSSVNRLWHSAALLSSIDEDSITIRSPEAMRQLCASTVACRVIRVLRFDGKVEPWKTEHSLRFQWLRELSTEMLVGFMGAVKFSAPELPPTLDKLRLTLILPPPEPELTPEHLAAVWSDIAALISAAGQVKSLHMLQIRIEPTHGYRSYEVIIDDFTPAPLTLDGLIDHPSLTSFCATVGPCGVPRQCTWPRSMWAALKSCAALSEVVISGEFEAEQLEMITSPPMQWQRFDLDSNIVTGDVAPLFARFSSLTSFEPFYLDLDNPSFLSGMTALTDANLSCSHRVDPAKLVRALSHCKGIATLRLRSSRVTAEDLTTLLPCLPALTDLALSRCESLVSLAWLSHFTQEPRPTAPLRRLLFYGCESLPPSEFPLLWPIRNLASLTALDIGASFSGPLPIEKMIDDFFEPKEGERHKLSAWGWEQRERFNESLVSADIISNLAPPPAQVANLGPIAPPPPPSSELPSPLPAPDDADAEASEVDGGADWNEASPEMQALHAESYAAYRESVLASERQDKLEHEALMNVHPLSEDAEYVRYRWLASGRGQFVPSWPCDGEEREALVNYFEHERAAHVYTNPTRPLPELHRDELWSILAFMPLPRVMFASQLSRSWLAAVQMPPRHAAVRGNGAWLSLIAGSSVARKHVSTVAHIAHLTPDPQTSADVPELLDRQTLNALWTLDSLTSLHTQLSIHEPTVQPRSDSTDSAASLLPPTLRVLNIDVTANALVKTGAEDEGEVWGRRVSTLLIPYLAGLMELCSLSLRVDLRLPWAPMEALSVSLLQALQLLPKLSSLQYVHSNPHQQSVAWTPEELLTLREVSALTDIDTGGMLVDPELCIFAEPNDTADSKPTCISSLREFNLNLTRLSDTMLAALVHFEALESLRPLSVDCVDLAPLSRLSRLTSAKLHCSEAANVDSLVAALTASPGPQLTALTTGHPLLQSAHLSVIIQIQSGITSLSLDQLPSLDSLEFISDNAAILSTSLTSLTLWSCPLIFLSDLAPILLLTALRTIELHALAEEIDDEAESRLAAALGVTSVEAHRRLPNLESFVAGTSPLPPPPSAAPALTTIATNDTGSSARSLHRDALHSVFDFLHVDELSRVACVCRSWAADALTVPLRTMILEKPTVASLMLMSLSPVARRHLTRITDEYEYSLPIDRAWTADALQKLSAFDNLHSLDIHFVLDQPPDEFVPVLIFPPQIRRLTLRPKLDSSPARMNALLLSIADSCSLLESLTFQSFAAHIVPAPDVRPIGRLTHLTQLHLDSSFSQLATDAKAWSILHAMSLQSLRSLRFSSSRSWKLSGIDELEAAAAAAAARAQPWQLTTFHLANLIIVDRDRDEVNGGQQLTSRWSAAFKEFPLLDQFSPQSLKLVDPRPVFECFRSLREIILSCRGALSLPLLAEALRRHTQLEVVSLDFDYLARRDPAEWTMVLASLGSNVHTLELSPYPLDTLAYLSSPSLAGLHASVTRLTIPWDRDNYELEAAEFEHAFAFSALQMLDADGHAMMWDEEDEARFTPGSISWGRRCPEKRVVTEAQASEEQLAADVESHADSSPLSLPLVIPPPVAESAPSSDKQPTRVPPPSSSPPASAASPFAPQSSQLYRDALHSVLAFLSLSDASSAAQVKRGWCSAFVSLPPLGRPVWLIASNQGQINARLAALMSKPSVSRHVASFGSTVGSERVPQAGTLTEAQLVRMCAAMPNLLSLKCALWINDDESLRTSDDPHEWKFPCSLQQLEVTLITFDDPRESICRSMWRRLDEVVRAAAAHCPTLDTLLLHSNFAPLATNAADLIMPLTTARALASMPLLRHFRCDWDESARYWAPLNWPREVWQILGTMPSLQILELRNGSHAPESFQRMAAVGGLFERVEEIALQKTIINHATISSLARLRSLVALETHWLVDDESAASLALAKLTRLRTVSFIVAFPSILLVLTASCPQLTSLTLHDAKLVRAQRLAPVLTKLPLAHLDLRWAMKLGSLSFLVASSTLQSLRLEGASDMPLKEAETLLSIRSLTSLSFAHFPAEAVHIGWAGSTPENSAESDAAHPRRAELSVPSVRRTRADNRSSSACSAASSSLARSSVDACAFLHIAASFRRCCGQRRWRGCGTLRARVTQLESDKHSTAG